MFNRISTFLVASLLGVSTLAVAPDARAQSSDPADFDWPTATDPLSTAPNGFRLETHASPAFAPAPLPLPGDRLNPAVRFGWAWLAGSAGSFGGAYIPLIVAYLDESGEDHDLRNWLTIGAGSSLGSGVLAGAVHGSVGRGLLGGVLGFAGFGAMLKLGGLNGVVAGSVIQGLVAAAVSASGK